MTNLSTRTGFAAGAAACAALLGFAYYLQYGQGIEPCPLCLVQRAFVYAVMAVFVLGAAHAPARTGALIYAALIALLAAGGAATGARKLWLQHLPADQVPQCGPDLYFMLENFPLSSTLEKLMRGTGECAKVEWSFLGLSIAGWSTLWFVVLAASALWLAMQAPRAGAASSAPAASAAR